MDYRNSESSVLVLNDEDLPQETVSILGSNPEANAAVKCELYNALKNRSTHWLTHGLQKNELSAAKDRVILPSNVCLVPPLINPEFLPILNKHVQARDRALYNYQSLLGFGLVELSKVFNLLLLQKEEISPEPQKLLSHLSDSGRFLRHLFYDISKTRRQFVYPAFNKNVKELAAKMFPSADLLFGPNLVDLIKTAKQLETTGKEIRATPTTSSAASDPNCRYRFSSQRKRGGEHSNPEHLNRYRPVRRPLKDMSRKAKPYRGHSSRQEMQTRRKR